MEMMVKADKLHLKKLLSDAIPLLCKNGLPPLSEFRVEAMIGITINNSEVALICINETVTADGDIVPQVYGVNGDLEENEELGYREPGNGSVVDAEGCRNGSESYGGVIDLEEYGVKQERNDGLEQDMTGYEDAANRVVHPGGYLYDGKMADDVGYGRNPAPRLKRPRSFAVGSDHFVAKEFDNGTEDCVAVKEELGLDESAFADAVGFQDSVCTKSRSSGFRAFRPGANFASPGETSAQQPYPTWPSKTRRMGPIYGRKVLGNKTPASKTSRNTAPMSTSVELQSPADQRQFLNDLCREMVQDSVAQTQFFCHICNTRLGSKTSLVAHIKGSHIDAKLYACNQCDQSFKWYMQLYRHKKCHHPGF